MPRQVMRQVSISKDQFDKVMEIPIPYPYVGSTIRARLEVVVAEGLNALWEQAKNDKGDK